jgi:hypothetical protein
MMREPSALTSGPRYALLLCAVFLSLAFGGGQRLFAADGDRSIRFSWAFLFQGKDGITRPFDYDRRVIRLESGDKIKIYLKPLDSCYLYLYLYDGQNNLFLLFPEAFNQAGSNPRLPENFELPGVNSWYYLDDRPGTETFYLIVSSRPLVDLEERTKQFFTTLGKNRRTRQILTDKHSVLDEIKRLIKESSYLSDAAEKPVAVAGDFRGIREERVLNGVYIEANEIYVKTIRVAH